MVVVDHLNIALGLEKYFGFSPIKIDLHAGAAGVNLFFVISGFIIAFISLDDSKQEFHPRIGIGQFLWRRFARIVPFLWVCVIGYAAFRFVGRDGAFDLYPYMRALFLYPIGPVNPSQVWTLRHEMLFYFVFTTVILFASRRFVLISLWFISPILFFSIFSPDPTNALHELLTFLFSRFNILFGLGFLASLVYMRHPRLFVLSIPAGMTVCSALSVLYLLIYVAIDYSHESTAKVAIVGLGAAAVLYAGLSVVNETSNLFDRLGKILGDASYSIYLTHGGFVSAILGVWAKIYFSNQYFVFAIAFIVVIFLGIVAHYYVELPLVRTFQRLSRRRLAVGSA